MPADRLTGDPVAAPIRAAVSERARQLADRELTPTLGTVLASEDPAAARFMALKHAAAESAGIATRDVRPDPGDSVVESVRTLNADPAVNAVFVQAPLPGPVDELAVRLAMDPRKDVDCFHPTTLGRLVAGDPAFLPATPAAVLAILDHYAVPVAGQDVVVVGRSPVIGRPLVNLLWRRRDPGDATVTVCHTRTRELAEKTRQADVVVTAAGEPELVDGSMLAEGVTVVDVSANRVPAETDRGFAVVGDVAFESASGVAGAITPVPGGVGPVTLAMLLRNVIEAAEHQATEA